MKDLVKKNLETVASRWRTRYVAKNNLSEWFADIYPGVNISIAIDCLVNDQSPYCMVCNDPIKSLGKKTCSRVCNVISQRHNLTNTMEKRKNTMIERYGVENISQLEETKSRRRTTMLEKYGALVSPITREKSRQRSENLNIKGRCSLQQKYGVNNASQLPNHHEKCKVTLINNYGTNNYFHSEEYIKKSVDIRYKKWEMFLPDTIKLLDIVHDEDKKLIYDNPNQLLKFKCVTCNNIEQIPTETIRWRIRNTGTPCIKCSGISLGSLKQQELHNYIDSLGIVTVSNFVLADNRQLDIYCPDQKIGFEFNGLYWHNDLRLDKKYHLSKTNVAHQQDIKLIHVFEDEWHNKQEIVKSRIRNIFKKNINRVYARNCQIVVLDKIQEREFLELNHIQGYARSDVAMGLTYDNKLISIISFSKLNPTKGQTHVSGHWDLLRFCSALNTSVIGAAGKLLRSFIKNHQPLKITSYADKRWSVGNLYNTLGFEKGKDTAINYWYVNLKELKRIHRYSLRKNKDDPNLTEYQNRQSQGYLRIWDCGSSKWIWKNQCQ